MGFVFNLLHATSCDLEYFAGSCLRVFVWGPRSGLGVGKRVRKCLAAAAFLSSVGKEV